MYNQELWILPLMSMFSPDMSKSIINSRLRKGYNFDHLSMYDQAREAAKQDGNEGVRYPWEQGDYGIDVSPYLDARQKKIHTSADISFGIRSYLRLTHGKEFLLQAISPDNSIRGEDLILEISKYWFKKLLLDPQTNKYGIKGFYFI
jgi:trehalose/maltose hydrolase-like predicted phosphorylase